MNGERDRGTKKEIQGRRKRYRNEERDAGTEKGIDEQRKG